MQEKKLNDVLCMIFSLKILFLVLPKVQPALSFSFFYFLFIQQKAQEFPITSGPIVTQ